MNLGNPKEVSIVELSRLVADATGQANEVQFLPPMVDDPAVRCPDISLARRWLGWEPRVSLPEGLSRTVAWARETEGW
jgi:dTDP-glucose 4,6-dehydratase